MTNNGTNKLALKSYYENNKEAYYDKRSSSNKSVYDEHYKWEILPKLNERLAKFERITRDNIKEFLEVITDNSSKSNFAHWIDIDDMKMLGELPYGNQILDIVWQVTPETVSGAIDAANNVSSSFSPYKKFSPSTWGYVLAAKNCDKFAIYRDFICKELIDINNSTKTKGLTQGEKYQLLNDSALFLGELMRIENDGEINNLTALNGQDFLWVTIGGKSS